MHAALRAQETAMAQHCTHVASALRSQDEMLGEASVREYVHVHASGCGGICVGMFVCTHACLLEHASA